MFRSFRPSLETLEKREVFSAGTIAPVLPVESLSPGTPEIAELSPRDPGSATGNCSQLLPYVEQDNLQELSSSRGAFRPDLDQSQIIAVLIGLVHSPRQTPGVVADPIDPDVIYAKTIEDIEVENDETHWVGHDRTRLQALLISAAQSNPAVQSIVDGTSNTLMFRGASHGA